MSHPRERRPPSHDPEGRRADVLDAARRLFAKNGYAQTSIRAIAAEADVNHALVVTYFGGKEALFMEAVGRFQIPQNALAGSLEDMGARIARAYVERWENMADDDPWLALVHSSFSHEASYRLLRSELAAQQTVPLGQVFGGTGDGPARSAMVECLIAGMIMARYIYRLEPAASLPAPAFEAAFAATLQQAITGPLTSSERDGQSGRAASDRKARHASS
jgi:AcrR family transcriptional regulator